MLQTASHFAYKWSSITEGFFPLFYLFPFAISLGDGFGERHEHEWAGPLTFAVTGLVLIGIALYLARRRRDTIPSAEAL
jgi:LPXTG-motif cell wall-anchored protein